MPFDAIALACSMTIWELTVFEKEFHEDQPIGGPGTGIIRVVEEGRGSAIVLVIKMAKNDALRNPDRSFLVMRSILATERRPHN
jgi:hypothetical protein